MAGIEPLALPDGLIPGKVIGVHLNYHSRAAQRGRVPTEPSYFIKATTALSGGGDVVRPPGTELLAFEAEIAVIIGDPRAERHSRGGRPSHRLVRAGQRLRAARLPLG